MAMLGELCVTSGNISSTGRISYCSQVPWLFYGTLRENILFGEDFVEDKYKKVVAVCSLLPVSYIYKNSTIFPKVSKSVIP